MSYVFPIQHIHLYKVKWYDTITSRPTVQRIGNIRDWILAQRIPQSIKSIPWSENHDIIISWIPIDLILRSSYSIRSMWISIQLLNYLLVNSTPNTSSSPRDFLIVWLFSLHPLTCPAIISPANDFWRDYTWLMRTADNDFNFCSNSYVHRYLIIIYILYLLICLSVASKRPHTPYLSIE